MSKRMMLTWSQNIWMASCHSDCGAPSTFYYISMHHIPQHSHLWILWKDWSCANILAVSACWRVSLIFNLNYSNFKNVVPQVSAVKLWNIQKFKPCTCWFSEADQLRRCYRNDWTLSLKQIQDVSFTSETKSRAH